MQLRDYLREAKKTYAAFGEELGTSAVSVHRFATGQRLPTLPMIARIERKTAGLVTVQDWMELVPESLAA